jgi:hypothetical protein
VRMFITAYRLGQLLDARMDMTGIAQH